MKPTYDYTELSKQQLQEQIKYDTEQYFKRGGKIKFYDQANNLVSEYVEDADVMQRGDLS